MGEGNAFGGSNRSISICLWAFFSFPGELAQQKNSAAFALLLHVIESFCCRRRSAAAPTHFGMVW